MRLELNQEPEHRVVWQSLRGDWDQIQFRGMVWHSEEIGIKSDSEVWFDTIRGNWDQIQFRSMVWHSQRRLGSNSIQRYGLTISRLPSNC